MVIDIFNVVEGETWPSELKTHIYESFKFYKFPHLTSDIYFIEL